MVCMPILTYPVLTYLDYVAYGCLHPCFDLVAELVHLGQLPLAATPQRYRLTLTHLSLDSE